MLILALDLGMKRTGVAFADSENDFVMALDTITHESDTELIEKIGEIVRTKKIDEIVVGLPLLPGGEEGKQATIAREMSLKIEKSVKKSVKLLDERFSTPHNGEGDRDACAALEIANISLGRRRNRMDL